MTPKTEKQKEITLTRVNRDGFVLKCGSGFIAISDEEKALHAYERVTQAASDEFNQIVDDEMERKEAFRKMVKGMMGV